MDSESSTTQTTTTQQTTAQTDNRRVLGAGAMLAEQGSSINISTSDPDVAKAAINAGTEQVKLAFGFGVKSQGLALDALDSQAALVKDAYTDAKGRGALTDKILIGAIAMSGLVAIAALRK